MNSSPPTLTWKQILRQNFTNWEKLANFLELSEEQRQTILKKASFPLNLPLRLAQKIVKGTLEDPILQQFLPINQELVVIQKFSEDPIGDAACRKSAKLIHKYQGRVLLVCTSVCAMHCRFCFRQHFDYEVKEKAFVNELKLIEEDQSIHEVILSGGDPLSLSNAVLSDLLESLSKMPHVKRIRFHTRFPIGIPERLDEEFLAILRNVPCQILFVTHINHARELDEVVLNKLKCLQKSGIVVLNQAVLLKGVNDNIEALEGLCELLVDNGVVPYYLHQLDRVQGAAHFEVSVETGLFLIEELAKRLPHYAVPKYVRENAGEPSKTLLTHST